MAALARQDKHAEFLHTLWKSETPYIHWRMPWVGYEYWDPQRTPAERFISDAEQEHWIGWAGRQFKDFFGQDATSACAPGYRANSATHRIWKQQGILVAQNGPGTGRLPHFDSLGLLHTYRSLDFEPALNPELRWEDCVAESAKWLTRGLPLIVSMHSINFHSTLAPFRQKTLPILNAFLNALQQRFSDLVYVNDGQLLQIIEHGYYESAAGKVPVTVSRVRSGALR